MKEAWASKLAFLSWAISMSCGLLAHTDDQVPAALEPSTASTRFFNNVCNYFLKIARNHPVSQKVNQQRAKNEALAHYLDKDTLFAVVKELPASRWREEVNAIDQAVDVLTDLRNKELARAARAQDQGDRLQFQFPNLIDARRAWAEADKSRAIAARYQDEIDKLNERKKKILQQHGEAISAAKDGR